MWVYVVWPEDRPCMTQGVTANLTNHYHTNSYKSTAD